MSQSDELIRYTTKYVFDTQVVLNIDALQEKFAFDIPLPHKSLSQLSDKETWTYLPDNERIAHIDDIEMRFKKDEWMVERTSLRTMEDILSAWKDVNYIAAEKSINSQEVHESDDIINSAAIYRSRSIFDSKNIVCSYNIVNSNYLLASRDVGSSQIGIRIKESKACSKVFEVSWSNKVSQSMYIHDGLDLFECLFCSHIRSKKYCIANRQFEKEEYFTLKKIVVEWILS